MTFTIFNEIKKVNTEKEAIEAEIARVKSNMAVVDKNEVLFFLSGLKNGDVNSKKYRKALISIFVNSIYLYDDKIVYEFNTDKNPVTLPIEYFENAEQEKNRSYFSETGSPRKKSHLYTKQM